MRHLLKASSYYPAYLQWFYGQHPELHLASYAEQHAALMADGFALSDSWSRYLGGAGRPFQVTELVVNAESLQKQWAREHGVAYQEESWMQDIFFAQFAQLQPQLLYAHAPEVGPALRARCRELARGKLFVLTYDGIARNHPRVVEGADLVVSCLRSSADYYESIGVKAHVMKFGFDPAVTARLDRRVPVRDVTFVGGLAVRIGHQVRARVLDDIARGTKLDAWVSGLPDDAGLLRQWFSFARHGEWRGFADFPPVAAAARRLRDASLGTLFGMKMLSQLAASRMTLNVHIAAAGAEAANIRLFESTGVGACLVTDWKENLAELFEPDREVVTFRSSEEALEKINYLLNHEAERQAIAERGQRRTQTTHNYAVRLAEFEAALLPLLD